MQWSSDVHTKVPKTLKQFCRKFKRQSASPVLLLQFLVGLLLELGQKLLQQFFGSLSVSECAALVGKVECGALASVEDQLELDFGFAIWADLLTCSVKTKRSSATGPADTPLLIALGVFERIGAAHSEYLRRGG